MSEPIVSVVKGSLPCVNGLGEGPHWDAGREELFYVDIMKHAVFRYIPKTEECYKVEIGKHLHNFKIMIDFLGVIYDVFMNAYFVCE